MKKFASIIVLMLVLCLGVFAFSACGNNDKKDEGKTDVVTPGDEEDAGFTEVEIFSDVEREFLHLNAVYFQPVDMTGGYNHEDYDCHLELDVSALENNLGYGTGDWVPYLTVNYEVTKNGGTFTTSGTFMPMAASDGPHYGANISLDGNGLYTVTFTIEFPDSDTYLIHTDETGPDAHAFPSTIRYTYDKWQFTEGAWEE